MTGLKNRADLLLALLYAGERSAAGDEISHPIVGITRLEKLLFLLRMEEGLLSDAPPRDGFHFVPFRMGPWTQEVYDEVDFLESLGLLATRGSEPRSAVDAAHDDELFSDLIIDKYQSSTVMADAKTEVFDLTEAGRKKAAEIWKRLPAEERARIVSLKKRFNSINLKQLLRYVYKKYPEYTTESEIKETLGLTGNSSR